MDLKQQTGFMLIPENKTYTVLQPGRTAAVVPFFRVADPEDACATWEKTANKPGTCTKVGDETIDGRAAVKYMGTAGNGDTGSAWVDRKLRFAIKWDGKQGASELRNFKEGPQPAALFELPKDYDKMDSQAPRQGATKQNAPKVKIPAKKP
jgi:hypothetical protein